jgi:hypothetical protein
MQYKMKDGKKGKEEDKKRKLAWRERAMKTNKERRGANK